MPFYLGPGGAGDALADTANESAIAVQKALEAAASAAAAAASAASANTAATDTVNFKNSLTVAADTLPVGYLATASYDPNTVKITFGIPVAASGGGGTSGVTTFNGRAGTVTLSSSDVTSALSYTPYNSSNPAGYITASGAPVQSVAGKTGTVTLTKTDVGLSNVDNTADASKPVSTAQQAALDAKQNLLVSGTNIKTINGASILGSGDLVVSGGGGGVTSFNTRTGSVTLTSTDVTAALGYTPYNSSNPAGYTSNTGTVTSVDGTGTVSGISLSGTVTSSGSLTLGGTLSVTPSNFASQTANTVLAAPNGAAGVPTFRALVAADIPTLNQNTTGTASNVTGTVAIANGGTGATTASAALTNLGAYPASNPNGYTSNTGTVTSVTGTAPISSSGGTAPVISIPAASTTVDGYLTSANFTTFNNKQAALVSGTNIKTINGASILGSGDITVAAGVTVSDTAPTSPVNGQEWEDGTTGIKYTYIVDNDSSAWVELGPSSTSISGGGSGISTGKSIAMAMIFGG